MNYKQIHKALEDKGLSWTAVGTALGCSYQHVMNVSARRADSKRVAKAVALLIEKDVSDVFPDKPQYANESKAEQKKSKVEQAKARLEEAGLAVA